MRTETVKVRYYCRIHEHEQIEVINDTSANGGHGFTHEIRLLTSQCQSCIASAVGRAERNIVKALATAAKQSMIDNERGESA